MKIYFCFLSASSTLFYLFFKAINCRLNLRTGFVSILVFTCCLLWPLLHLGQRGVVVAGNDGLSEGGSMSFTLGQGLLGTEHPLMEGVQQPWEIWVITGVELEEKGSQVFSVYPNPVKHQLTINLNCQEKKVVFYGLFDLKGEKIKKGPLLNQRTLISMQGLDSGVYLMKIFQKQKILQTFKILKN